MTSAQISVINGASAPEQPEVPRLPRSRRRGRMPKLRAVWTRRPNFFAFLVLGALILGLGVAAWTTGFHSGFWPNFLLNSAGDLIGGMVVLFLIEPIVRQAAAQQIRQYPRLDYAWFLRRGGEARVQIRILDTFSGLFDADRDAAIRALRDAAVNGVDIRVLLMSPNTDASALREFQLRQAMPGLWINDRIQENIADFRMLDAAILAIGNGHQHGRLELRLYTVAAPFSLYSWDGRALFAFLPPHAFSDRSTQLEITDQSQLGREALDHFEAIWQDAAPIPQLLPIQVVDEQTTRDLLVRFVHLDRATYLVSKRIDAAIRANPALRIHFGDQNSAFQAEVVTADDPVQSLLNQEFYTKYARRPDALFHLLRPLDDSAPADRPKEFDSLPTRTLMDLIAQSRHTIRILDTSSSLMAEGGTQFTRAVEQAMARGVRVRVLLLAPTTQAAQDRAAEIQDPAFDTRIEENIRELRRLARKMTMDGVDGDLLEVRLYDRLPECSVHQVDDRLMVAFLPYQRRTSKVRHFEIGEDASLGQFATLQFAATWAAARPLEGMRYADLTTDTDTKHLLLRIWDASRPVSQSATNQGSSPHGSNTQRARYLASTRIESIVAANNAARGGHARAPELRLVVEDRPGEEFLLSDPIAPESAQGRAAIEAFVAIFGVEPDAPIRRLDPVGGVVMPSADDDDATAGITSLRPPDEAATVQASIYLSDEAGHEEVERAVINALTFAGLRVVEASEPVLGSWFRRFMAGPVATTAMHGLESRAITMHDAQVTALLLQSLPSVIAALDNTDSAVIRLQAVLVVKLNGVIAVHQLSAEQQFALDHLPELAASPAEIISALALTDGKPYAQPQPQPQPQPKPLNGAAAHEQITQP